MHRQRLRFDPELSLVAEIDGGIVGHALFSPRTIRLMNQNVEAVNLAPLAVNPDQQGLGIGSALMHEGHRIAHEKGYAVSFLLGHSSYYPRFGYVTRAFGASSLQVAGAASGLLETRPPVESDVPLLHNLWLHEEGAVDFAIDPGESLLDWVSSVEARVYLHEDEVVGYRRGELFLAKSGYARAMVTEDTTLALHPYSASAQEFGQPEVQAWDAGMALGLHPSPFDEYYALLQAGKRLPGRPIWPVAFD